MLEILLPKIFVKKFLAQENTYAIMTSYGYIVCVCVMEWGFSLEWSICVYSFLRWLSGQGGLPV